MDRILGFASRVISMIMNFWPQLLFVLGLFVATIIATLYAAWYIAALLWLIIAAIVVVVILFDIMLKWADEDDVRLMHPEP